MNHANMSQTQISPTNISIIPLIRKEIISGLNNVSSYLAAAFFLIFSSVFFLNIYNFATRDYASFREFFSLFPILFVIIIPIITMRSWAEENKSGTSEILLTMPYKSWQLVLGKFLGSYLVFASIIILTIPLLFILQFLGDFSPGPVITQYFGVFLLGGTTIALGQFVSCLCKNQITAALVTITSLLLFTLVFEFFAVNIPTLWISNFFGYFSLNRHFESFARGVLDSRDLMFFIIFAALFLYFNTMTIIFRKWR